MHTTQIISDLHVGAGPLDDCDGEVERGLCDFLHQLATDGGEHELVIAGDFLDFAQAPPTEGHELEGQDPAGTLLCFSEEQSSAKLAAILASHPAIWDALRQFLDGHQGNRLVIMPGNHDADFFWPSVRSAFVHRVVGERATLAARITFHLETVYRPRAAPSVWIEHGHQYDPLNSFFLDGEPRWSEDKPPILVDRCGTPRLLECIGTRFMVKFMNRLDALYPFVDNVKPFHRFIQLFVASLFATGHGPMKAAFAILALMRFANPLKARRVSDVLSLSTPGGADISLLGYLQRGFNDETRLLLQRRLIAAGFPLDRPLMMLVGEPDRADALVSFISDRPELLDGLDADPRSDLLGIEAGTLALGDEFFFGDETMRLKRAAQGILEQGLATQVIMGHTHEPVERSTYLNTGCWTRYYTFEKGQRARPFDILRDGGTDDFPYRLQYAEIVENGTAASHVFRERKKVS